MVKGKNAAMKDEEIQLEEELGGFRHQLATLVHMLRCAKVAAGGMHSSLQMATERSDRLPGQVKDLESDLANARATHKAEREEWSATREEVNEAQLRICQELAATKASLASLRTGSDIVVKKADWELLKARLQTLEVRVQNAQASDLWRLLCKCRDANTSVP